MASSQVGRRLDYLEAKSKKVVKYDPIGMLDVCNQNIYRV